MTMKNYYVVPDKDRASLLFSLSNRERSEA